MLNLAYYMSSIYFMKTNIRFISRIGIWTIMLLGAFQQLVAQRITYSDPREEVYIDSATSKKPPSLFVITSLIK